MKICLVDPKDRFSSIGDVEYIPLKMGPKELAGFSKTKRKTIVYGIPDELERKIEPGLKQIIKIYEDV